MRAALPMIALFAAAFATTWMWQSRSPAAVTLLAEPTHSTRAAPAARWDSVVRQASPVPDGDRFEAPAYAPTLAELTLDPDPDTKAEAQTLVTLLDAEGRQDYLDPP